ncbi:hypothetical protein [Aquimarina agarilytica]|uniref:hypothetical protein n=1 Tax=Aquimarina agarilytica TaxID=1087449 RepID=UPI000289BB91|nr:hypothetical protein [Aquimarina agarilytica]
MNFSKNTKKAGWVLVGSSIGYLIAKKLNKKDNYLYILVGGFIGTCIAEELLTESTKTLKK